MKCLYIEVWRWSSWPRSTKHHQLLQEIVWSARRANTWWSAGFDHRHTWSSSDLGFHENFFCPQTFWNCSFKVSWRHNFYGNDKTNDDVGDDENHGDEDWWRWWWWLVCREEEMIIRSRKLFGIELPLSFSPTLSPTSSSSLSPPLSPSPSLSPTSPPREIRLNITKKEQSSSSTIKFVGEWVGWVGWSPMFFIFSFQISVWEKTPFLSLSPSLLVGSWVAPSCP